jgi:hypothetical protein
MRDGIVAAIQIPLPGSDSIQTDLGSVSEVRDLKIKTTASGSARTLMLPNGFPHQVHEYEKLWPACSRPSRCQRRTSIDLQPSKSGGHHKPVGPSASPRRNYRNHLANPLVCDYGKSHNHLIVLCFRTFG